MKAAAKTELSPRDNHVAVVPTLLTGDTGGFWRTVLEHFPAVSTDPSITHVAHAHVLNVNYPAAQLADADSLLARVPAAVRERLRSGQAKLIFSSPLEGHRYRPALAETFHEVASRLGCRPSQLIFLTQNQHFRGRYLQWSRKQRRGEQERIKVRFAHSALLRYALRTPFQLRVPADPLRARRRFLLLNNQARAHRIFLFERLLERGLLAEGLVSFNCRIMEEFGKSSLKELRRFYAGESDTELRARCERLDAHDLPRRLDLDEAEARAIGRDPRAWFAPPWRLFQDTCFSVVTETDMGDGRRQRRFTEKSLKPLFAGHPFVVAGQPGTLAALRELGFRTFQPLIDERYDEVTDPALRAQRVVDEVGRLCTLDAGEFSAGFRALLPTLHHNQRHFSTGLRRILLACLAELLRTIARRRDDLCP